MKPIRNFRLPAAGKDRLFLPAGFLEQYGISPGSEVLINRMENGFLVSRSPHYLAKVYLEVTNSCNLDCRICIRNVWDEPPGLIARETFTEVIRGMHSFFPKPVIFFGGYGEPLSHPNIVEMVHAARQAGCRVELITNGTLLDRSMMTALVEAGVDTLWVSLDGASPEHYSDIRLGADLPKVVENLAYLQWLRNKRPNTSIQLGIAFVAMRRNIADLPSVIRLGQQLGASRFSITNLLAHTESQCKEILYQKSLYQQRFAPSHWTPEVDFPRLDLPPDILATLQGGMAGIIQPLNCGQVPGPVLPRCPFLVKGSLSIRWDGSVSPCLPLLHSSTVFLDDRRRTCVSHSFGNIHGASLRDVWMSEAYVQFRARLMDFDFSPCTICNSCEMADSNQEDCFGNTAPTCGGCLWAHGFIQCP